MLKFGHGNPVLARPAPSICPAELATGRIPHQRRRRPGKQAIVQAAGLLESNWHAKQFWEVRSYLPNPRQKCAGR